MEKWNKPEIIELNAQFTEANNGPSSDFAINTSGVTGLKKNPNAANPITGPVNNPSGMNPPGHN